jgi:ATP-dependent exoDNAse (exonuclease V) alpha subunit
MRQQGDTTFADLLNALRVGQMRSEHFQILMSKVSTDDVGEFAIDKALRIKPTNEMVDKHNAKVIELYRAQQVQMSTIVAQDQLVDSTRTVTAERLARMVPTDIRLTGGLPKELVIFVGAKVMLRANIDVAKGLVNGNIGHITEIVWPLFRRAQLYDQDIPSVKVDFGKDGIHLIEPKTLQFPGKHKSDGLIERRMLPLILSWASTVHKMQGCTVDNAKVYLGPGLFAKGQAYVSLSRVRSLDGLQIDELDCSRLMGLGCCNTDALAEMERMRHYQPPPM